MPGTEKLQPAFHRRERAERYGVAIEHPEIVHRALFQRFQERHVVLVRSPAAKLVPARPKASLEKRNYSAQMMRDDLEIWMLVEQTGEDHVRHGCAGLIGPAERPPDLVVALLFGLEVHDIRAAHRVHPDRQIEL